MAKKRRRLGGGLRPQDDAAAQAAAGGEAPEGAAGGAAAGVPSEADLALLLRAVGTLAEAAAAGRVVKACGEGATLREALQPLIAARAAKYEEDAKAAKIAEAAAGNPANARPGAAGAFGSKKRPPPGVPAAPWTPSKEASEAGGPLTNKEMSVVLSTSAALAKHPDALASKVCKPLRSALHPLVEAHIREEKASPAFRITCALAQRSRWPEALRLLGELRKLEPARRPKLGAYQRWVREIGAAAGDDEELAMLDAIMRVAVGLPPGDRPSPSKGSLELIPPWRPELPDVPDAEGAAAPARAPDSEEPLSTANRLSALIATRRGENIITKATAFGPGSWSIVAHEAGLDRQPPNRFDLDICSCKPGVATLTTPPARQCQRHDMPGIEGSFALSDVLSRAECTMLRELTEAIGYRPDVPLSSPLDERAQNVVLYATDQQNEALFSRIRHLLPQQSDGATLQGLNRRWRVYRYEEGNLYRKHLDGAWPASGMRVGPDGRNEYVYDAYGNSTRSRYTFIIYLNDDCEGGCTTFFLPKVGDEGVLESRPVKPRVGSASVFPHGETGMLLHEGSSVLKGRKYLLRTEIVYTTGETTEAMKEAKRLRGLARQLGGLGGKDLLEDVTAGVPNGKGPPKKPKAHARKGRLEGKKKGKEPTAAAPPGKDAPAGGVKKKTKKGQRMAAGGGKRGGKKSKR